MVRNVSAGESRPTHSFRRQIISVVLVALVTVVAFVSLFAKQSFDARSQAISAAFDTADTLARFAADHAARSMESVEASVSRVADRLGAAPITDSSSRELGDALTNSALIREIAIVDESGRILASSDGQSIGRMFSAGSLFAEAGARPGTLTLGAVSAGRRLGDASAGDTNSQRYLLPAAYVPEFGTPTSHRFIVAINPEYFTAMYDSIVIGEGGSIRLLSFDGHLISASRGDLLPVNASLAGHPPFDGTLRQRESGRLTETAGSDEFLTVFRATRMFPLVVSVRLFEPSVLETWKDHTVSLAAALAILPLIILIGTAFLTRQLRERERQRVQLALSEQTARQVQIRLLDAIDNMSDAFALFDQADNLVLWNEQYINCFPYLSAHLKPGLSFESIVEIAARNVQFPADDSSNWKAWRKRKHANPGTPFEQRLADGKVLFTIERRTAEGGTVLLARDISAERSAVLALQKARVEADTANNAKSEFVAMVSHEIRTPMNAVIGLTELLLDGSMTEEQMSFARGINQAAQRLLTLINDVLDFSQLDANKLELEVGPLDLRALIDEAARVCLVLVGEKPILVTSDVAPDIAPQVQGDSGRLYQVLINFLGNAAKFTERGSIACRARLLHGAATSTVVRIEVVDTGPGIPADEIARMFAPFERGNSETSRRASGAGLGLAISKRFIDLMKGRIGIDSVEGKGTTAFVELDLPEARSMPTATVPSSAASGTAGGAMRILVAEDTDSSQLLIRSLLERRGHRVRVVANGAEAIKALQEEYFDVAFLDMQMPVMGGMEAAAKIRAMPDLANIRLVALTAQTQPEFRAKALSAGIDDYLVKPMRAVDLDAVLAKVGAIVSAKETTATNLPLAHPADALLDDNVLAELRRDVGSAVVDSLLEHFALEARGQLALIADRAEQRDIVKAACHKLAGLFAQFGAVAAANIAADIETACHARADISGQLPALARIGEESILALHSSRVAN